MGVVSIRAMKRAGGTAMEKGSKDSNDGYAPVVGGAFVGIVVVVSMVPEPVWIALGIVAAFAALIGASYWAMSEYEKALAAAQDRANTQQAAQAAAAKQQRKRTRVRQSNGVSRRWARRMPHSLYPQGLR